MSQALIAISVLWALIFIYAIAGSFDFGAGFWAMIYAKRNNPSAAGIANRFLSPSWEVTNTFLVLLVVAVVSFFPKATFTLGTVLLLPGSLILILLTIRSAFMVYSHSVKRYSYSTGLRMVSGITGLLIPGLLISVLPIIQGEFIDTVDGVEQLLMGKLFSSATEYAYLGFGITSTLFLSTILLADYSRSAGDEVAYGRYRQNAVWLGPITIFMAFLIILTLNKYAGWLMINLKARQAWFLLSIAAFALGYAAMWWKREGKELPGVPRLTVVAIVIQYAVASYAYGAAHLPYIVYPNSTVMASITNQNMFRALIISYIVGLIILLPGFIYFWRMFLKDKRYVANK
jgi:cytochrome bd ubiquinol oxidase subunit II